MTAMPTVGSEYDISRGDIGLDQATLALANPDTSVLGASAPAVSTLSFGIVNHLIVETTKTVLLLVRLLWVLAAGAVPVMLIFWPAQLKASLSTITILEHATGPAPVLLSGIGAGAAVGPAASRVYKRHTSRKRGGSSGESIGKDKV